MRIRNTEKGQALILIVFAIVGLVGLTGLAVDGSLVYADRRHAQNAADSAAWAAALAYGRGQDIESAVQGAAATNGYDNNGGNNEVILSMEDTPAGECPGGVSGKDITVRITSQITPYFSPAVGIRELSNHVQTITRSCESFTAPPFTGNAIVALAPSGKGFDATGNPDWTITNGGIFANSTSANAAYCNGAASVITLRTNPSDPQPGIRVAGGTDLDCSSVDVGAIVTGVDQYDSTDYQSMLPPIPDCDGTATFSNGVWHAQDNAFGSNVAFSSDMTFASGLYCVTNSPGPFHGQISSLPGAGVTFYITSPNFQMKFNGGGNLTASAPNAGSYAGVLMYLAPQFDDNGNLLNTQAIDMRGNGTAEIIGSIIAPSADVTMFGNSNSIGFHSQIIAYQVDTGGGAYVNITYDEDLIYNAAQPITLYLLK